MVQIAVTSTDGTKTVWVEVEHVSEKEYGEIQQYLCKQLETKRHFESIAKSFQFAVQHCPLANPSDVWQHIIYRTYLQTGRSEQSWKRASGQAFENAFAALYNPRLVEHGIRLVVLTPSQIVLALKEMGLSGQVGQSKLDIAVIGRCERYANSWRLFGGIHAKVSIAERISDDEPASRAMISRGYFSVVATLDSKSFPPPHGDAINRGELGFPKPGKRADKRELRTTYTTVKPGHVAGLRSFAYGVINGERVIELNFESHGGVGEEFDSVEIEGMPNVREVIHGGVNGDIGTAAMLINSIPKVLKAAPGLITMLDIPIPHATP